MIIDLSVLILTDPLKIKWHVNYNFKTIICYSAIGLIPAKRAISILGLQAHIERIVTEVSPESLLNDPDHFKGTLEFHDIHRLHKVLR